MAFLEAAKHVLAEAHKPLSATEITRRALDQGLIETKGKTPANTLYAVLLTAERKHGEQAEVMRSGGGKWALRAWALEPGPAPPLKPSTGPQRWLFATNPKVYDIETIFQQGGEVWGDVIKGHLAQKRMREEVREGDTALVYRSRPHADIYCEVKVVRGPYRKAGKHVADVEPLRRIEPPVTLRALRACPDLAEMEFLRNPRVSISPLSQDEYAAIEALVGEPPPRGESFTHDEVMWYLIAIGKAHGLEVWVATDARKGSWGDEKFAEHCLAELPHLGLDEETVSLIRGIDVLWLRRNRIVAAFEIEHTTSIYSGLLRLADLLALQPNTLIDSYIVASASRRSTVFTQLGRPVFSRPERPLGDVCRFVPYDQLAEVYEMAQRWGASLKVDMASIAEDWRTQSPG